MKTPLQLLQIVEQRAPLNPSTGCNTLSLSDAEIQEIRDAIGTGPRETARVTLPVVTHGELVDFFPILRGIRDGFERSVAPRILDADAFSDACATLGTGGFAASRIVLSLTSCRVVDLQTSLNRLDFEHRLAFAAAVTAIAQRGLK